MKSQFTPGPWVVGSVEHAAGTPILQNGNLVASAFGRPKAESVANAQLIASAPELLAALEAGYVRLCNGYGPSITDRERLWSELEVMRKAIAKAKGGGK